MCTCLSVCETMSEYVCVCTCVYIHVRNVLHDGVCTYYVVLPISMKIQTHSNYFIIIEVHLLIYISMLMMHALNGSAAALTNIFMYLKFGYV